MRRRGRPRAQDLEYPVLHSLTQEDLASMRKRLGAWRAVADELGVSVTSLYWHRKRLAEELAAFGGGGGDGGDGGSEWKAGDARRALTMVFTSEKGQTLSVTQREGDGREMRFTFCFWKRHPPYYSAVLRLAPEEIEAVKRGLTYAVAASMMRDALRLLERGSLDAGEYVLARISAGL